MILLIHLLVILNDIMIVTNKTDETLDFKICRFSVLGKTHRSNELCNLDDLRSKVRENRIVQNA